MQSLPHAGVKGKVILLNGASSSGKTTIAIELQRLLPEPFLHFSFDHLRDGNILPMERIRSGEFRWCEMRPAVFETYHRTLAAMAESGCNVLADHIIESEDWRAQLQGLLQPFDVFIVAVKCPPDVLQSRELQRGDRKIGDALRDVETCYDYCRHDLTVDSSLPAPQNAKLIIEHWLGRVPELLSRFRR